VKMCKLCVFSSVSAFDSEACKISAKMYKVSVSV